MATKSWTPVLAVFSIGTPSLSVSCLAAICTCSAFSFVATVCLPCDALVLFRVYGLRFGVNNGSYNRCKESNCFAALCLKESMALNALGLPAVGVNSAGDLSGAGRSLPPATAAGILRCKLLFILELHSMVLSLQIPAPTHA